MPNHKTKSITLVRPHVAGTQLISLKKRPNDPCQCGSGKKQKNCHGRDTIFWSPKPPKVEPEVEMVQEPESKQPEITLLYISLKHTHKKDKWLTFWRANAANYTFILAWVGNYKEEIRDEDVCSIPYELAVKHMIEVEYEGKMQWVVPNTAETRKAFGITLKDLKEFRPYKF